MARWSQVISCKDCSEAEGADRLQSRERLLEAGGGCQCSWNAGERGEQVMRSEKSSWPEGWRAPEDCSICLKGMRSLGDSESWLAVIRVLGVSASGKESLPMELGKP